jgi:signal peptidase
MLTKVGSAALLLFVAALVAPAAAPIQISYVVSDSMSPTLATDDGYVLIDTGSVEVGDIITYYSDERGTSVTHRAVAVTEDGIVTQGDANPSTDQAAGYPLVQPADVAGEVLTVGGTPLRIPHLGAGIALLQDYWYVAVGVLTGLVLFTLAGSARNRERNALLRSREVILTVTVVAVIVGVALISFAATEQTTVYQVTAEESTSAQTLTVGEARTESLTVRFARTPMTYIVTDTEGMTITDTTALAEDGDSTSVDESTTLGWLRSRLLESEGQTVIAEIPAQEATGPHRTDLTVYSYPATLPRGIVAALHDLHPVVAALSTILVIVGPLYGLYWALVDTMAPLRATRNRRLQQWGGDR